MFKVFTRVYIFAFFLFYFVCDIVISEVLGIEGSNVPLYFLVEFLKNDIFLDEFLREDLFVLDSLEILLYRDILFGVLYLISLEVLSGHTRWLLLVHDMYLHLLLFSL